MSVNFIAGNSSSGRFGSAGDPRGGSTPLAARAARRGLAPFEFAIVAPLLLFMMALMVNFATTGAWRVRGEIAARDQAFRVRWPRTGRNEPWQPSWREGDTDAAVDTRRVEQMNELDLDAINHPVVRGPIPNGFVVKDTLDPKQGMINGWARMDGQYPMLRSLGSFSIGPVESPLLDRTFQNAMMSIPNEFRRTLAIYELPQTSQGLVSAYLRSIENLRSLPNADAVRVMDRDEDMRIILRHYVNFFPYLRHPYQGTWLVNPRYCERDPEIIYEKWILSPGLIDRVDLTQPPRRQVRFGQISGLPGRLCGFFLRMYRHAKREIERLTEMLRRSDLTPEQRTAIMQRLAELRQIQNLDGKIEQLENYQQRLPELQQILREKSIEDYERYPRNTNAAP